jgi:hypothetical protein
VGLADLVRGKLSRLLSRLAREPLLHFVFLGALLFAAYSWVGAGRGTDRRDDRIVIDQAQLGHLEAIWRAQWKRDPARGQVRARLSVSANRDRKATQSSAASTWQSCPVRRAT